MKIPYYAINTRLKLVVTLNFRIFINEDKVGDNTYVVHDVNVRNLALVLTVDVIDSSYRKK